MHLFLFEPLFMQVPLLTSRPSLYFARPGQETLLQVNLVLLLT